jgi:hypothetical protein
MESVLQTLETGGHPNSDEVETIGYMITSKKPALASKGLYRPVVLNVFELETH